MQISITLSLGQGVNLGPYFNITTNDGVVVPSSASLQELQSGIKMFSVSDLANKVYITSMGQCSTQLTLDILDLPNATTLTPTLVPTITPTQVPTSSPTTIYPTVFPTLVPTSIPTLMPTASPTTITPTISPTTILPTSTPTTITPTSVPTVSPTTVLPTTVTPTVSPTTIAPTIDSYGRLYNFFVVDGSFGELANTGWHVPTYAEWRDLETYLGGQSVAGGALRDAGTSHWLSPNTGATNSSGFTAYPSGYREVNGSTISIGISLWLWSSDIVYIGGNYQAGIALNNINVYSSQFDMNPPSSKKKYGLPVRLIKNDSSWTIGDKYIGNDGQEYDTIKIGTQVWLLSNLKETKYRSGVDIPEVLDNTAWAALSTDARCYYI